MGRRLILALAGIAAASLVALPVLAYVRVETVAAARWLPVAAMALTLAHPSTGLLVVAGLLPLTAVSGELMGATVNPVEAVLLGAIVGFMLHSVVRRPSRTSWPTARVSTPAWLLLAVGFASLLVQIHVVHLWVAFYPWPFGSAVLEFLSYGYFADRGQFDVVAKAALLLEGVGLYLVAVSAIRRDPRLAPRLVRMVAAGAFGVAVLNVSRLLMSAVRTGDVWASLEKLFRSGTVRISTVFPDYNAAGSYLVLMLVVAAGLAVAAAVSANARRPARWAGAVVWAVVAVAVSAALWLTGSRAALAAVVPGALAAVTLRVRRVWALAATAVTVVGLAVLVMSPTVTGWLNPAKSTGRSIEQATTIRREMSLAALRMTAERPWFGVGAGAFHSVSSRYIDPAFRATIPRENAHNNYLQLLAELGAVGFAVVLWMVVAVVIEVGQARRTLGLSPSVIGVAAGLMAFGFTCLAGHPLLIFEVATAFWLLLAALAGTTALRETVEVEPATARAGRRRTIVAIVVVAVLAVSVPFRSREAADDAVLQSASIGLSAWESDARGERYRRVINHAQIYVPTDASYARVPLRLEAPADHSIDVEISLDGEVANRVRVRGNEWTDVGLLLPTVSGSRRFRPVEIRPIVDRPERAEIAASALQLGTPVLQRAVSGSR
jgi:hypothetical protein